MQTRGLDMFVHCVPWVPGGPLEVDVEAKEAVLDGQ